MWMLHFRQCSLWGVHTLGVLYSLNPYISIVQDLWVWIWISDNYRCPLFLTLTKCKGAFNMHFHWQDIWFGIEQTHGNLGRYETEQLCYRFLHNCLSVYLPYPVPGFSGECSLAIDFSCNHMLRLSGTYLSSLWRLQRRSYLVLCSLFCFCPLLRGFSKNPVLNKQCH